MMSIQRPGRYYLRSFAAAPVLLLSALLTGCGDVPDFSPDGKRLVFSMPDGHGHIGLAVSNVDGTGFHRLPGSAIGKAPTRAYHHLEWLGWPRWSPDGRYIAFLVLPDSKGEPPGRLYLYDTESSEVVQTGLEDVEEPVVWRPDGKRLVAFQTRRKQFLATFYEPGRQVVQKEVPLPFDGLHHTEVNRNGVVAWIPGRDSIAVVGETKETVDGDLYLIQEDRRTWKLTTTGDVLSVGICGHHTLLYARDWDWSEDSSVPSSLPRVMRFDLHTMTATAVPSRPAPGRTLQGLGKLGSHGSPLFSPDGKHMVFAVTNRRDTSAVYLARIDGRNLRRIHFPPAVYSRVGPKKRKFYVDRDAMTWSRDGKRLALRNRDSIYIFTGTGAGKHRLPLPSFLPRVTR